jgi:hypothetical protein
MTTADTGHRYSAEFPREAFVQQAIERHFAPPDYVAEQVKHIDLVRRHLKAGKRWLIEAKGQTSDVGLDFRTCLGQIVQAMYDRDARYGIAVPDTRQYRAQCRAVSDWVRRTLGLYWLLVAAHGSVRIIAPTEIIIDSAGGPEKSMRERM